MFWGTVSLQFLPWSVLAVRIVQSGQLPLWNPLVGMGAPLLANYQSGLLYPPNWVVLLSAGIWGAGWGAWVQTWLVTFHLVWAGLGMYYLARRIGISPFGQVICGFTFALSGYLVSRSAFISINAAVSWMPWFILSVTWLACGKTTLTKLITTGIIACLLLLAGHAQTAWYTILFSLVWLAFFAWQDSVLQPSEYEQDENTWPRNRIRYVLFKFGALLIALGLGVCLAAAQLIPTAEYLLHSQRSRAVEFDYAMTYSFWPWRFLTLLAPGFFGSPVTGDYWGYANYWEDALYIGVLPVFLAISVVVSALLRYRRKRKPITGPVASNTRFHENALVRFLFGIIIVAFVLALGKNTPIFPWLYRHIPTFAAFQAPTRFSIWAVISLILLAGIGVDRIKRPQGRGLYWTRLGTAGAAAITLGAGLAWYFLADITPSFISSAALLGFFCLCAGLLILSAPVEPASGGNTSSYRRGWELAFVLILGFELILVNWNLNPGIDREFYDSVPSSASRLSSLPAGERLYLNPDDEHELKFNRFMRFDSYLIDEDWSKLREVQLPNLNILDGIPSANNFDPLVSARYARWMDALHKIQKSGDDVSFTRLLNLMGVGAVEYLKHAPPSQVAFEQIENSSRMRWVPCALFAGDGDESLDLLFNRSIDFEREVIIENGESNAELSCEMGDRLVQITLISEQPNQIKMSLSSPEDGWLVLSDAWYPGWKAEIDGKQTPIYRANYLFRAINLPAGEHIVSWDYLPASFIVGLVISAFSWIFVAVFWLIFLSSRWRHL